MNKDIKNIFDMISTTILKSEPGDYVELVNENDTKGPVQFYRKSGSPFMIMSREDYEEFKKYNKQKSMT